MKNEKETKTQIVDSLASLKPGSLNKIIGGSGVTLPSVTTPN